jgi:ferredoxin
MTVVRLVVDPVRCTGIGICAHAGGRVVDLDAWGYPLVPKIPLAGRDASAARAAAKACPRRALFLLPLDEATGTPTDTSTDAAIDEPVDQPSGAPPVTPST